VVIGEDRTLMREGLTLLLERGGFGDALPRALRLPRAGRL
jgi:hypothetical protein